MNPELFYSREARELPEGLSWGKNLVEERPERRLQGLDQLAEDLGYGPGRGGQGRGTPGAPDPVDTPKKKLKGAARVSAMLKQSKWNWKGSSLDPGFKRPKIRLKRKKEDSSSSSTSNSQDKGARSEDSEGEDLFPEEHQSKYIARKCPGLLFRHGIKQAKSQVLALQGEASKSRDPEPVFLRYHRQVFQSQSSSPPLRREHLTISTVVDHLIKGEILKAGDILVQRMKALEQIAQGAPAHMSMKLEVIPADQVSMVSPEEARTAATEHAKEWKLQNTWKGKGVQLGEQEQEKANQRRVPKESTRRETDRRGVRRESKYRRVQW
eukprot:Skav225309  [mRNA]  locus=scaffold23:67681:68652:- [translate_table: standard]